MIEWPAILKSSNDDELLFVATPADLQELQQGAGLQAGDMLVDSGGMSFALNSDGVASEQPQQQMTLEEVLALVRRHASVCGHCCVSKMGAPGIAQAVALVDEIE